MKQGNYYSTYNFYGVIIFPSFVSKRGLITGIVVDTKMITGIVVNTKIITGIVVNTKMCNSVIQLCRKTINFLEKIYLLDECLSSTIIFVLVIINVQILIIYNTKHLFMTGQSYSWCLTSS